jgi:hypothetical protein
MKRLLSAFLIGALMLAGTTAFADTVYATKNGKKYHRADCPLIEKKSPTALSLEEAQKKGLKPCGKCFTESAKADPQTNQDLAPKKK